MTRKSLQLWVLSDEAQVTMISRVKRTEGYILQGVEIVVAWHILWLVVTQQL
jgi:hypothetical protein